MKSDPCLDCAVHSLLQPVERYSEFEFRSEQEASNILFYVLLIILNFYCICMEILLSPRNMIPGASRETDTRVFYVNLLSPNNVLQVVDYITMVNR